MPNFKLIIEYDGTAFAGWQVQPGRRTVQGTVEAACRAVTGRAARVTGAGRTDAGVHAAGQVASVGLSWRHDAGKLAAALTSRLPADVAVVSSAIAPRRFNARRDARERAYRYVFLLRPARSPLLDGSACRVAKPVSLRRMRAVAALFRGRHDFSAFCAGDARRLGTIRRVTRCALSRRGPLVLLDVRGDGFLHRMVRLIAGALLDVGGGRLSPAAVRQALRQGADRPLANAAPAGGLALLGVRYGRRWEGGRLGWPPGCNISCPASV